MTEDLNPQLVFEQMPTFLNKDKAAGVNATIQFDLSGDKGGKWWVKVADGEASSGAGETESPNLTLIADGTDYIKISRGEMNATVAFMQGKLKVKGDMGSSDEDGDPVRLSLVRETLGDKAPTFPGHQPGLNGGVADGTLFGRAVASRSDGRVWRGGRTGWTVRVSLPAARRLSSGRSVWGRVRPTTCPRPHRGPKQSACERDS